MLLLKKIHYIHMFLETLGLAVVKIESTMCTSQPFMTKKSSQKITLDLHRSHTQRPDLSIPRNKYNNCLKSIKKTKFIKPVIIVLEFHHFSTFFVNKKRLELNFKWLNIKLLELISIVSSDCRAEFF